MVAEFGMFKGGTTMLISKFIEEMGADWKVFGFDTFDGFPPRRSALDMFPIVSSSTSIWSKPYLRDAMSRLSKEMSSRRFHVFRTRTWCYLSWILTTFRPQAPLSVS